MNLRLLLGVLASVLITVGCATQPERIDELERARAAVAAIDRDPMAEQVAGAEVEQAKEELARAEQLFDRNEDLVLIRHYAYLATRHAEIAEERVGEAKARAAIEESEAERNEVLLQARSMEAQRAEREADLATAEAREAQALAELRGEQAEDARELAERRGEMAEYNAQVAMMERQRANALEKEAKELEASLQELEAEQTERGLVLTLSDVLFDTGESDLKPGAANAIDQLAAFLNDNSDRRLLIEGHTDSRGSMDYNRQLSERRADAVRAALVSRGVTSDRLRTVGYGQEYPVATNDTVAGRQENRRVEIIFSDQDGAFPAAAERSAAL